MGGKRHEAMSEGDSGSPNPGLADVMQALRDLNTRLDEIQENSSTLETQLRNEIGYVRGLTERGPGLASVQCISGEPSVPNPNIPQQSVPNNNNIGYNNGFACPTFKFKDILTSFDTKRSDPIVYIKSLEKLRNFQISEFQLKSVLRNTLVGSCLFWFDIIERNFQNIDEYIDLFRTRFWNRQAQTLVRSEIQWGQFNERSGINYEEYFTNLYYKGMYLTPPISEQELIEQLSRHFNFEIHQLVLTRDIRTYDQFCDLLRRFDTANNAKYDPRFREHKSPPQTRNDRPQTFSSRVPTQDSNQYYQRPQQNSHSQGHSSYNKNNFKPSYNYNNGYNKRPDQNNHHNNRRYDGNVNRDNRNSFNNREPPNLTPGNKRIVNSQTASKPNPPPFNRKSFANNNIQIDERAEMDNESFPNDKRCKLVDPNNASALVESHDSATKQRGDFF